MIIERKATHRGMRSSSVPLKSESVNVVFWRESLEAMRTPGGALQIHEEIA